MTIHNASNFDMQKVSIISPCYNAGVYIEDTYNSLVMQTYSNWEWIVVDDCSTDNSLQKLKIIAKTDPRVHIFTNEVNSGAAATRNHCLSKASGMFVAFLDIDDIWKSNKLKYQIEFMNVHHYKFSYHHYSLVDANGNFIKNQIIPPTVTSEELLRYNPFATSSVMISRALIEYHCIQFKVHLRQRQDYIFWYEVISVCKKAYGMDENLSSYRLIGEKSLSSNKKKMAYIQWRLYRNEFKLGLIKSIYYFVQYAIHGINKYFIK